jgi:hypothetical protein
MIQTSTMTEIQNIKPVLVIEKLRFEIYLQFGAWNLEFNLLFLAMARSIKQIRVL